MLRSASLSHPLACDVHTRSRSPSASDSLMLASIPYFSNCFKTTVVSIFIKEAAPSYHLGGSSQAPYMGSRPEPPSGGKASSGQFAWQMMIFGAWTLNTNTCIYASPGVSLTIYSSSKTDCNCSNTPSVVLCCAACLGLALA